MIADIQSTLATLPDRDAALVALALREMLGEPIVMTLDEAERVEALWFAHFEPLETSEAA